MKTYQVTRTYTVNVPEDVEYTKLVQYFMKEDPEFFENKDYDPALIWQQMPYWITYQYDVGNLTDLVIDVDATAKEVKDEQVSP